MPKSNAMLCGSGYTLFSVMTMFTGIVEEVGEVAQMQRRGMAAFLGIRASFAKELKQGDSVCVNGVCLTVVAIQPPVFWVEAVEETLARTNLGFLKPSDRVNLERALSASGRFGGHFVQGHVDGTGVVAQIVPRLRSKVMRIHTPKELMPYIVPKGSIAVDGVSLTVVDVGDDWFTVWLIPFTLEHTTLGLRKVGDVVNLEVDILAKYVRHMLASFEFTRPERRETLSPDERLRQLLMER